MSLYCAIRVSATSKDVVKGNILEHVAFFKACMNKSLRGNPNRSFRGNL